MQKSSRRAGPPRGSPCGLPYRVAPARRKRHPPKRRVSDQLRAVLLGVSVKERPFRAAKGSFTACASALVELVGFPQPQWLLQSDGQSLEDETGQAEIISKFLESLKSNSQ